MQKKIKKWALVGKAGEVIVFKKKPIKDKFLAAGDWVDMENKNIIYPNEYWKLKRCEVTICKKYKII